MIEMWSDEALTRFLNYPDVVRVLDVGSGDGEHAKAMREAGKDVTTVSLIPPADIVGDYLLIGAPLRLYDGIWASHVLEHQRNVGLFLDQCFDDLREGGVLAITVPPAKSQIVGGHLTLWNPGLLVYNLILAGFDCREARVHQYGYNISVVVRKKPATIHGLIYDKGDIERLSEFFPFPVKQGFSGQISANWGDE